MTGLYRCHHLAHQWAQLSAHWTAQQPAHLLAHPWAHLGAHLWAHCRPGSVVGVFGLLRAVAGADTGWRHVIEGAPQALRLGVVWLRSVAVAALVAVAIGAVVVVAMRRLALRRYLAARGPLVRLVPTPAFDPNAEEVLRFATTVLRTHRATRLAGVRAGSAVRVRLHQVDGRVVFDLEGHRRVESVLRVASYSGVERRVLRPSEPASVLAGHAALTLPAGGAAGDGEDAGGDDVDG